MKDQIFRVLLSNEENMFVAQCLEHDISVQAEDMETLQRRFEATLLIEMQSGDLATLPPAPKSFYDKWNEAQELESMFGNTEIRFAA